MRLGRTSGPCGHARRWPAVLFPSGDEVRRLGHQVRAAGQGQLAITVQVAVAAVMAVMAEATDQVLAGVAVVMGAGVLVDGAERSFSLMISNTLTTFSTPLTWLASSAPRLASRSVTRPIR